MVVALVMVVLVMAVVVLVMVVLVMVVLVMAAVVMVVLVEVVASVEEDLTRVQVTLAAAAPFKAFELHPVRSSPLHLGRASQLQMPARNELILKFSIAFRPIFHCNPGNVASKIEICRSRIELPSNLKLSNL